MNIPSVSASLPFQSAPSSAEVSAVPRDSKSIMSVQEKIPGNPSASPVGQTQLNDAIKSVEEYIKPYNNNLEFSINDETDKVVVKIVDSATKEVIRQIPSEEMVAIAKALDSIKGLFVKQKV